MEAIILAQLLATLPSLIADVIKLIRIVQEHPGTPEENRVRLAALANDLEAAKLRVQEVPLVPIPQ